MGNSDSREALVYSVPEKGVEEVKGETPIYRSPKTVGKELQSSPDPNIKTIKDLILNTRAKHGNRPFLMWRTHESTGPYISLTHEQVTSMACNLAKGIFAEKLTEKQNDFEKYKLQFVGVYAKNRKEWVILDQACALYNITIVPIYDTLGPEAVRYVYDQTNLTTLFTTSVLVDSILKEYTNKKTNKLATLVIMDELKEEQREKIKASGLQVYQFQEIVEVGKKAADLPFPEVKGDDIYTFSYTSGTTGVPKAAMLTHTNMLADIASVRFHHDIVITHEDLSLSYLPLAHVFERVILLIMTWAGGRYAIYCGDTLKMSDDMQEVHPTIFPSVPRLFNRVYEGIMKQFAESSGFKKIIIERAVESKLYYLSNGGHLTHKIYDSLVFDKIREKFGGSVRIVVTASAPLSTEVLNFFKIAFGCPVIEAYGQTESGGASFATIASDSHAGHVGGPMAACEFKLVDIPEMKYLSTDKDEQGRPTPRGEVCLRGPGIIPSYYKDSEKTKEAINKDGWLMTGDVGVILTNGSVKIIDRKKNIFKLQQGEYVAPEKIENIYSTHSLVENVFVYGDSLQNHLVGVVVPKKGQFTKWAEEQGVTGEFEELCKNEKLTKALVADLGAHGKKNQLLGFENVKALYLDSKPFATTDLITPSFKLKRNDARTHYEQILKDLYKVPVSEGGPAKK